ncbi:AAA family ATPase [Proteiniclasticum sp. C24MP]|uniref:ATP-binding protein n=1 Tax=Proteiniclasticum sp. C24MP TaxID=3374101 RepID=UPI003754A8B5
MLIKNISIEQFGKLKKRSFEFHEGINVIQGENEAGKSTLQSCILSMFYGARTSRRYNLDIRKRYIPFGGNHTLATMEVALEHQNLMIERKISGKRREDLFRIYDSDTYDQASFSENLGKELFDVELEEFVKTLYISQNGTKFLNEKDEALATKLTNLLESGDEEISFTKAMNTIDKEMKLIKGARKNGRLDVLYQELSGLHISLEKAKAMQKKILERQSALDRLQEEEEDIRKKKEEVRILKDRIHLYEVKDEFLRIRRNLEELKNMKEQKTTRFMLAEDKELKNIREKEMKLRDLEEDLSLLEDHLEGLKRRKIETDMSLEPFKGYEEIGREALLTMVRLQGEELLIEEKLKYFKNDSALNKNLLERREELSRLLKNYEKHLTGLKSKRPVYILTSAAILLSAFVYQALMKDSWTAVMIGAASFVIFYLSRTLEKMRISHHLHKVESIEGTIRTMSEALKMDPNEVIRSKRLIEKMPRDKERLQLIRRQEEVLSFKNSVFQLTNTGSVEELMKGEEKYTQLLEREKELRKEIEVHEKEVETKKERKEDLLRSYKELLAEIGYREEEHDLYSFLDLYDLEIMRLQEVSNKEAGLNYALKGLIGDREESEVQKELDAISSLGISENLDLQTLENRDRALTERLQEIHQKHAEHHLEMKEMNFQEPLQMEEAILSLQEEEMMLKRRYEVLELTKSLMEDSYEKLRKEFTGPLNDSVTAIYREITGKDRTVKVSEVFSMNYQESGMLWQDTFLSHGSMEQLYLSLRIAMADLIYNGRKVPLILDEAFSSYDEERLKKTLLFLQKCTDRYQIFIFTCHKREMDILKENARTLTL